MKTIGELIDSLQASGNPSTMWLGLVCGHTDPDTLAQFKTLEITEHNVLVFCQTIAAQIRQYLAGTISEEHFQLVLQEGREFFDLVFEQVKNKGIPKSSVCVPISYVDMAVNAGVVEVNDGMVSLTEKGEQVVKEIEVK